MNKNKIDFAPCKGDRISFLSDIQFGKGPFDGAVLRLDNGIAEIGHKGCSDEWGFVICIDVKVKSILLKDDGTNTWNLY